MTEHNPDRVRNALAFTLVLAFVSVLPFFVFKDIPSGSKDIITYMVGQLSGMATMALGFYFTNKVGQDQIDEKRAANTAKLADAVVAVAAAQPVAPSVAASAAADAVAGAATDKAAEITGDRP